ncbi:MAG: AI-2E family transporter [Treponema sp.]|nr:AI-2E family transporter [Treponema sp.]
MEEERRDYTRSIYNLLLVLGCVLFVTILKITQSFSIPLVIAVFLSLVVLPLLQKIHKKFRVPWFFGIVLSLVFFAALIAGTVRLLQTSISAIISAYPRYENRFLFIYRQLSATFNLSYDEGKTLIENIFAQLRIMQYLQRFALSLSGSAIGFIKNIFIVFLLYTFLLIEANEFQTKISIAFEGKLRHRVKSIIVNVIVDTTRFFSIKFIVSLATGILVYLGALAIRLDFAVIWAFIAFLLNFIPTFGSAISLVLTTFFAFVQFFPNWPPIIAVAILMLAVNFVLGNIVEPRIEGENLGISPFFILVSLSIWGWVWGFVGMILAVPFMVFIKIVCENIPSMNPIAIILGNKKNARRQKKKSANVISK